MIGWIALIAGLALWSGSHLWKRLAPEGREKAGDQGRTIVAVLSLAGIVLMVLGYRWAEGPVWWGRSPALVGINNLLMVLAFYLFASSGTKNWLARKMRHPQLTSVKTFAVAHLLVNGDLVSFVLFGGLLAWAVLEVILINRANRAWTPPHPVPIQKEVVAVVATVVLVGVVMLIHNWLGVQPWG